jgi:hypothetical protein
MPRRVRKAAEVTYEQTNYMKPRTKARIFDSMKAAAGATGLSLQAIRYAKEGGCEAFRSNRIYEAALLRWLVAHPYNPPEGTLAIETPLDGYQVLAELFGEYGIPFWLTTRAAFWTTLNSMTPQTEPAKDSLRTEFIEAFGKIVNGLEIIAGMAPMIGNAEQPERPDISAWVALADSDGFFETAYALGEAEKKKCLDSHPKK